MLSPGDLIGDRYTLKKTQWATPLGPVWLARDRTLDRAVLVQVLAPEVAASQAAVRTFQKTAARAAQITNPGLLHIFDIGEDPPFVVFEHAAGGRLSDRLAAGPMRPLDAVRATLALARGLEALHERGLAHGTLGPSSVVFDEEGRAKILFVGAPETAAAAGNLDARADQPRGYLPPEPVAMPADVDRYALAALLFHMVTGSPPERASARQVRRSVPQAMDTLLAKALSTVPAHRPTLDEFVGALAPMARFEPSEPRAVRRTFDSSEFRWLVPALLILGIAALALTFGVNAVREFAKGRDEPTPSASATESAPAGRAIAVEQIDDFDPPPGNGSEHPDDAEKAIDGDARTSWKTLQYSRENFGGQKDGVGLLIDLGERRTIRRARVQSTLEGWMAEFRIADAPGENADAFRVVKAFTAATDATVTLPGGTQGRYVLLWITKLVDNQGGSDLPFSAEVAEVELFS